MDMQPTTENQEPQSDGGNWDLSDEHLRYLGTLANSHIGLIISYRQALDRLQKFDQSDEQFAELRERFLTFEDEHEQHLMFFTNILLAFGEMPPDLDNQIHGDQMQGMQAVTGAISREEILSILRNNEEVADSHHDEALSLGDWPQEFREIIQAHRTMFSQHLQYFNDLELSESEEDEGTDTPPAYV